MYIAVQIGVHTTVQVNGSKHVIIMRNLKVDKSSWNARFLFSVLLKLSDRFLFLWLRRVGLLGFRLLSMFQFLISSLFIKSQSKKSKALLRRKNYTTEQIPFFRILIFKISLKVLAPKSVLIQICRISKEY